MYLNKMIMNRLFHTCKQLIGIAALSVGLYACDWIHDDSLPLCEFRLYFKYDYNMKFADAFQHEVDFVTLFVCDQEGNFLFQRRIEKSELDERNSMPYELQSKLLRGLQESYIRRVGGSEDIPVDVRVITTVNEDPVDLIRQGKLRQDLYYRLSVVTLNIPPLRERRGDIPYLAQALIEKRHA